MWSRLLSSLVVLAALPALSCIAFAQTYGTEGYSPGAWKPDELPKELSKPNPFNAHDLSGVWSTPTTPGYFERHSLDDKWIDTKDKKVPPQMRSNTSPPPMTEWGKAKFDANKVSYGPRAVEPEFNNDPVSKCEPLGYPRDLWEANLRPFEFIQTPDRVLQHMQYHDTWRTIWTDGRPLPKDPDPAWYGYAIGKWQGDTFVVESIGYDDRTWLDHFGNPHSDQMRLVERYRRVDKDTLLLDITLTDPKTYTKPWVADTITFVNPKVAIFEEICSPSEEHRFNDEIRDESKAKAKP
ncbi:MAG TPA: hypothetical protein VGP19_05535 [Candidatus Acidoferrales bacterium]|jgi:hypothetical protein|nr:hypothetical protein [Candidatus Acidoferrales bacterium]